LVGGFKQVFVSRFGKIPNDKNGGQVKAPIRDDQRMTGGVNFQGVAFIIYDYNSSWFQDVSSESHSLLI
jgi:hypothetical protein